MDKVTRILHLYAQLAQGKKVNKMNFCLEVDCLERSFDRDIEDIRLYLSEFFCTQELLYDRTENVYYLTNSERHLLLEEEYLFIERILIDSGLLMDGEIQEILTHVASNTNGAKRLARQNEQHQLSQSYFDENKITLKLFYDLQRVIEQKKEIRLLYREAEASISDHKLLPCQLIYSEGKLKLLAIPVSQENPDTQEFELKKIDSFFVIGSKTYEKYK